MNNQELIKQYYRLFVHTEAQKYSIAYLKGNEINYPHQNRYLTESDLISSIRGDKSLGLILCQDKTGLSKCGAIDIDTPRDAKDLSEALTIAQNIVKSALELGVNLYIEYSGNRGFHIWLFLEKAITHEPIKNALRAIALRADLINADIKNLEFYPKDLTANIKLPCTTHLKNSRRCGFISSNFDVNNPEIDLDFQSELMAKFEVTALDKLINISSQLENDDKPINEARSKEEIKGLLGSLGDHPSCIKFLLTNGVPLDIDYNQGNLTLIRYCLTKGLNLEESLKLAETMAKNTPENHSTSKDYQGKIKNFRSAYNSALRNSDNYLFGCSYVLSGVKEGEAYSKRGCIGTKCSIHKNHNPNYQKQSSEDKPEADTPNNQKVSDSLDFVRVNSLIFASMINLSGEGKECVKSQILRVSEKIVQSYLTQISPNISDSSKLLESEVLAYFLQNPEAILDYSDILPQGFKVTNSKIEPLSDYLDNLYSLKLPSPETIEEYIEEIRVNGLKILATEKISTFNSQIRESDNLPDTLNEINESIEGITRLSISDSKLLPVSEKSVKWVEELFSEDVVNIPTFSQDLNYLLNGGLCKGKLYVLGAPPANGKSTISAQISDIASSKGFKVGYASYEMSADQLFLSAISRHGKINSSLIESKKHFLDKQLATKLLNTCEDYDQRIGENLYLIECDDYHTPSKLLTIIKKLKLDLLIVDYLQLLNTGDNYLDNGNNETLKISKIATELKRVARKTQIPIIAISDINKNAYSMAMKGGDLDLSALRDSFKIAHSADTVMFLTSQNITMSVKEDGNNKSEKSVTQLYLLSEKLRDTSLELSQNIIDLAHQFKLDKNNSDTYSRLIIAKNRGGKCGEVLFRYSKALHYFEPLNYLTSNFNVNEEF